eukprot:12740961-Alexandrium_andersonii.AAC.1
MASHIMVMIISSSSFSAATACWASYMLRNRPELIQHTTSQPALRSALVMWILSSLGRDLQGGGLERPEEEEGG